MNKININCIHIPVLVCQKNHMANVIIKYNVVQTGANISLVDYNLIISWEYHGSFKLIDAKPNK